MSFVFIGRRMAQLSAKARENIQSYFWGRTVGELDRNRAKKCSNKEIAEMLPGLGQGEFVYWNGIEAKKAMCRKEFEQTGKPVRWTK